MEVNFSNHALSEVTDTNEAIKVAFAKNSAIALFVDQAHVIMPFFFCLFF